MERIKRVATVQDLSGIGRCSLTVVIPLLSVMRVQVCPVPTVILSTHMGGFGTPSTVDLTEQLSAYLAHWQSNQQTFDCLYSGYLANATQIHTVKQLFEDFGAEGAYKVVDPVMGDHGKLYSAYNATMREAMQALIGYADIITPNLTEAYFLIDEVYQACDLSDEAISHMLTKLQKLTQGHIVIKGVGCQKGRRANIVYNAITKAWCKLYYEEIPANYPGTGDAFCSVMIGYLMQGIQLEEAVEGAAQFVKEAVAYTHEIQTDTREGILIEACLGRLISLT